MKKKLSTYMGLLSVLILTITTGVGASAIAASGESPSDLPLSAKSTSVAAPVYMEGTGARLGAASPYTLKQLDQMGGDPRVDAYWTQERMANAIPVETPVIDADIETDARQYFEQESANGSPEVLTESAAAVDESVSPSAVTPVTNFSKTNGKVFFHDQSDGRDYICSGAAVNSSSKRLVATAGHCVHGGPGATWHANWVFVPDYNNDSRPNGSFPAYTFRTMNDWITYGATGRGFNSDVAFVTTTTNEGGLAVVNAVGGHGLITGGAEYVFDATLFGYPGNLDDGEVMWACWGTTGTRSVDNYKFHSISGCDFGGGASGGPWLKDYSNDSGLGNLKSVSSFGPTDSTAYISGPFFRSDIRTMYVSADADW